MYWWNLLSPLSGYKIFLYLKLEAAGFLRTLITRYETTQDISKKMVIFPVLTFLLGHAVAQLVEALRYKPEGRGFESRWCYWIFSLT